MTTATMTATDLFDAIANGVGDDHLDQLLQALQDRRDLVRQRRALNIDLGDAVRIANLRPKYLNGLTGSVQRRDGDRFVVRLDNPNAEGVGRYWQRDVGEIKVPVVCVEPRQ